MEFESKMEDFFVQKPMKFIPRTFLVCNVPSPIGNLNVMVKDGLNMLYPFQPLKQVFKRTSIFLFLKHFLLFLVSAKIEEKFAKKHTKTL